MRVYLRKNIDDTEGGRRVRLVVPGEVCQVLGDSNAIRINTLVTDIIEQNWQVAYPDDSLASQNRRAVELHISPRIESAADTLKQFLYNRVYIGSDAKAEESKVQHLLQTLFDYFCSHIDDLPPELKANPRKETNERLVVDYIAGMTDRFAIATFERLFVPKSWGL